MKNRSLNAKLRQISQKLSEILEDDTDEKVMVFTDNRALQELCAQINRLLLDRQKTKADYRKKEISGKILSAERENSKVSAEAAYFWQ